MTVAPTLTAPSVRSPQWSRAWPATALTVGIGLFGAVALGAVAAKPLRGADLTATDGAIVLAWALRGGGLMALTAVTYRRRTRVPALWAVLGVPGGLAFLLLLGLLIG